MRAFLADRLLWWWGRDVELLREEGHAVNFADFGRRLACHPVVQPVVEEDARCEQVAEELLRGVRTIDTAILLREPAPVMIWNTLIVGIAELLQVRRTSRACEDDRPRRRRVPGIDRRVRHVLELRVPQVPGPRPRESVGAVD